MRGFIDTHSHLNDLEAFPDYAELIASFDADNIDRVIAVGTGRQSSEDAVMLTKFSRVYATVGTHPSEVDNFCDADCQYYIDTAKSNQKIVGIGEAGLDYHYEGFDKKRQAEVFIRHLEIADAVKLPVVIHIRDAFEDTLKILKAHKHLLGARGLLHCYSGSAELLKTVFDLGLDISICGTVTFKNAHRPLEVARVVPIDRLHIETDCPYLSPTPHRGTRNQPKYVNLVAQKIAELREMDLGDLETALRKNAEGLFRRLI